MYNPAKPYKHKILRLIEGTWDTRYVKVKAGIYPVIEKKFSGKEIHHTDGIGTKGVYHWQKRTFRNAVIDAFAMNANDLAMAGALPYTLQDHIVVPEAGDRAILEIVRELARLCKKHSIAITGGETSHHDNLDAVDIGITMAGFITKERKNMCRAGDTLIGLKSNGLHSNGFTKVRSMYRKNEWRDEFIAPTAIYSDVIQKILKTHKVNAMMHITGGAFTKLRDLLVRTDADITAPLAPQPIFFELYKRGVSDRDMYATFNCGTGYILSVPRKEVKAVLRLAKNAKVIGEIKKGSGAIRIRSSFSRSTVTL